MTKEGIPALDPRSGPAAQAWMRVLKWEWSNWEDLIEEAIPMVPPGQALRFYNQRRAGRLEQYRASRAPGAKTLNQSRELEGKEAKIRAGARAMLVIALRNLVRHDRVEERMAPGPGRSPKELRLKDRRQTPCPNCGCFPDGSKPESDV